MLITSPTDNGTYELYHMPKGGSDGSETTNSKHGKGANELLPTPSRLVAQCCSKCRLLCHRVVFPHLRLSRFTQVLAPSG